MKNKRFCKGCGKELHEGTKFCKECGIQIGAVLPKSEKSSGQSEKTVQVDLAVSGMVCHSCENILNRTLSKLDGVVDKNVSYKSGRASVTFNTKKLSEGDIIKAINSKGYKANVINDEYKKKQLVKNIAVLGILAVIVVVVVSVSNTIGFDPKALSNASLGVIFIFGLITGFHCLGMCGGFVISYSAKLEGKYNPLPHLAYNIGRVVSYSALGAIVGFLGSLFILSYSTQGKLIILASFIMVLLGLNLLGVLTVFRRIKFGVKNPLAKFVSYGARGKRGPLLLGLLNGFVPCGMVYIILFTYVPFSGSALQGALAMAVFGLGTIPLMFIYGSAVSKLAGMLSKNFVKYSGVIVLILAVIMLNRGLVLAEIPDTPTMNLTEQQTYQNLTTTEYQEITMKVMSNQFVPNKFTVQAGKPVKWTIIGEDVSGCSNEVIMGEFNIDVPIETGQTKSVFFTPTKPGKYRFSCWMGMILGEIEAV